MGVNADEAAEVAAVGAVLKIVLFGSEPEVAAATTKVTDSTDGGAASGIASDVATAAKFDDAVAVTRCVSHGAANSRHYRRDYTLIRQNHTIVLTENQDARELGVDMDRAPLRKAVSSAERP